MERNGINNFNMIFLYKSIVMVGLKQNGRYTTYKCSSFRKGCCNVVFKLKHDHLNPKLGINSNFIFPFCFKVLCGGSYSSAPELY